jgi:hypothetical protein
MVKSLHNINNRALFPPSGFIPSVPPTACNSVASFTKKASAYNVYITNQFLTINVPVIYMARYVMVLRRAASFTRGIGKGGHWKSRLFWALTWLRANDLPYLTPIFSIASSLVSNIPPGDLGGGWGA